jgi:hypothetical protein
VICALAIDAATLVLDFLQFFAISKLYSDLQLQVCSPLQTMCQANLQDLVHTCRSIYWANVVALVFVCLCVICTILACIFYAVTKEASAPDDTKGGITTAVMLLCNAVTFWCILIINAYMWYASSWYMTGMNATVMQQVTTVENVGIAPLLLSSIIGLPSLCVLFCLAAMGNQN